MKSLSPSKNMQCWENIKDAAKIIDPIIPQFTSNECGRICLSNVGLFRHKNSHIGNPFTKYDQ